MRTMSIVVELALCLMTLMDVLVTANLFLHF